MFLGVCCCSLALSRFDSRVICREQHLSVRTGRLNTFSGCGPECRAIGKGIFRPGGKGRGDSNSREELCGTHASYATTVTNLRRHAAATVTRQRRQAGRGRQYSNIEGISEKRLKLEETKRGFEINLLLPPPACDSGYPEPNPDLTMCFIIAGQTLFENTHGVVPLETQIVGDRR